jgi:SAM-dependent methyltransferase
MSLKNPPNTSVPNPSSYGDHAAPFYDQLYPKVEAGLLRALADLAGNGRAMDLGIGTGRVAIPLRRAGVSVEGIDASSAMIAALRARPGAEGISVILGDFACTPLGSHFQLIYSLVSTLFLLTSLELQRACLENIARHLGTGGRFVSEASSASSSYPDTDSHAIPIDTPFGTHVYRVDCLVTPLTVLDGIAEESGLYLVERWSDWSRAPYDATTTRHISVYALKADSAV